MASIFSVNGVILVGAGLAACVLLVLALVAFVVQLRRRVQHFAFQQLESVERADGGAAFGAAQRAQRRAALRARVVFYVAYVPTVIMLSVVLVLATGFDFLPAAAGAVLLALFWLTLFVMHYPACTAPCRRRQIAERQRQRKRQIDAADDSPAAAAMAAAAAEEELPGGGRVDIDDAPMLPSLGRFCSARWSVLPAVFLGGAVLAALAGALVALASFGMCVDGNSYAITTMWSRMSSADSCPVGAPCCGIL